MRFRLSLFCLGLLTACSLSTTQGNLDASAPNDQFVADHIDVPLQQPDVPVISVSRPTDEQLVRACTRIASCTVQHAPLGREPAFTVTQCVSDSIAFFTQGPSGLTIPFVDLVRWQLCAADSATCAAYAECLGRPQATCSANTSSICDNGQLVICQEPPRTVDCARVGLRCTQSMNTGFNTAACTTATACRPGMPARCEGNTLVRCDTNTLHEVAVDCGNFFPGSSCLPAQDTRSSATCEITTGERCNTTNDACDGSQVVRCLNGAVVRNDCSTLGLICSTIVVDGRTLASCSDTNTVCTRNTPDQCNGNAIVTCARGRIIESDCPTGQRCVMDHVDNDPNLPFARCQPN